MLSKEEIESYEFIIKSLQDIRKELHQLNVRK